MSIARGRLNLRVTEQLSGSWEGSRQGLGHWTQRSGIDCVGSLRSGFVGTVNGRQVSTDASGDASGSRLDRIPCEVCVPGGRLNLRVTK